jgi:hypothetical protein
MPRIRCTSVPLSLWDEETLSGGRGDFDGLFGIDRLMRSQVLSGYVFYCKNGNTR